MNTRQQATLPRGLSTARRHFDQWRRGHRKHARLPEGLKTIVGNCLAHGRMYFVDVAANFPQECLYVLEILKDVYKNDTEARRQGMSPE